MKISKESLPDKKWWHGEVDFFLKKEFIDEIKQLEKVNYNEKKRLLMVDETISEREKTEFLFLISLYRHEEAFIFLLNDLESHLNRKPDPKQLYKNLNGKGVFGGFDTPRFWLEWKALYSYHIIDSFSGLIDRPMYYQLLTNKRIQFGIMKYVLEVGDLNSVSMFYDAFAFSDKDRKMPIEPLPLVDFNYILNKVINYWSCRNPILAEEKELFVRNSGHIYWDGIEITSISAIAYGPIDKPCLGLWKLKKHSKRGIITESHKSILSKIDKIRDEQRESMIEFHKIREMRGKARESMINNDIPRTIPSQELQSIEQVVKETDEKLELELDERGKPCVRINGKSITIEERSFVDLVYLAASKLKRKDGIVDVSRELRWNDRHVRDYPDDLRNILEKGNYSKKIDRKSFIDKHHNKISLGIFKADPKCIIIKENICKFDSEHRETVKKVIEKISWDLSYKEVADKEIYSDIESEANKKLKLKLEDSVDKIEKQELKPMLRHIFVIANAVKILGWKFQDVAWHRQWKSFLKKCDRSYEEAGYTKQQREDMGLYLPL